MGSDYSPEEKVCEHSLNGDFSLNRRTIDSRVTLTLKSGGGKGKNFTKSTSRVSIFKC